MFRVINNLTKFGQNKKFTKIIFKIKLFLKLFIKKNQITYLHGRLNSLKCT
jgi:hypothetical protein